MFWNRFYSLCVENNTKPNPVAQSIGLSTAICTRWKNGSIPNGDILLKIAEYFDVSVDYLLGKTDKKNEATPEEQPLTDAQEALLNYCSDLSNEDLEKVIDYIELLKLKNNAEQKERIKLVARSGEQKQIKADTATINELKEDTSSDY